MANITLNTPTLFADHHVLKARKTLLALEGIKDVYASSAWQAVIVTYDPEQIVPTAIEQALAQAGYPPGEETPILASSGKRFRDPTWQEMGTRVTETNQADNKMSGEFRKY